MSQRLHRLHPPRVSGEPFEQVAAFPKGTNVRVSASSNRARLSTGGQRSIPLWDISEGSHTYTAKDTDAANNTSVSSYPTTVTVDTTKPTVIGTAPLSRTERGAGTNLTVTFL